MTSVVLFFLSLFALPAFGATVLLHAEVRRLSIGGRLATALAGGAVALTVEALAFSFAGVPWSAAALAAPLVTLSGIALWHYRSLPREIRRACRPSRSLSVVGVSAAAVAVLYLLLSLGSSRATSTDFLLFWGVKGVRFAEARGIDVQFLKWPFAAHAVPDYPPLVPVLNAWGTLLAGKMPWHAAPLTTAVWLLATIPLLLELLRKRLDDDTATAVTVFWTVAMSILMVNSFSGASAEAPLLFFESAAVAALLVEGEGDSRFLAALALAGAVLTKREGIAAVILLGLGTLLRDLLERRQDFLRRFFTLLVWPGLAISSWSAFEWHAGLPVGYRGNAGLSALSLTNAKSIAVQGWHYLNAGTGGLTWIVPAFFLVLLGRQWRVVLPALLLAGGLLALFAFYCLHGTADPSKRIEWILPRVSQPAASALILAAGVGMARQRRPGRAGSEPEGDESAHGPPEDRPIPWPSKD